MKEDSQAHKAYIDIRKKILSSQIPVKTRLKEDFWAQKLGVSRIAVREALTRLLGERLVSMGEKGGYFVTSLTQKDFVHVRQLREILELGAVRLICGKLTRDNIERLEKICQDFTTMSKQGYFSGACEADIKFHESIIELADNDKLSQVYFNSHIPLFHQRLTKTNQTMNDYEQTDREHRAIVKALKEKNLAQAEKAMLVHFARGAAAVLELD